MHCMCAFHHFKIESLRIIYAHFANSETHRQPSVQSTLRINTSSAMFTQTFVYKYIPFVISHRRNEKKNQQNYDDTPISQSAYECASISVNLGFESTNNVKWSITLSPDTKWCVLEFRIELGGFSFPVIHNQSSSLFAFQMAKYQLILCEYLHCYCCSSMQWRIFSLCARACVCVCECNFFLSWLKPSLNYDTFSCIIVNSTL